MQQPNFQQTSSGGGHIETTKLEDGTWQADAHIEGLEAATAPSERDAVQEMTKRLYEFLQRGESGR